jgi:3-hydroxyisobutyrate dehydrogenase
MRVGIIGLGRMGAPIAGRLADRFAVTTYDRAHGGGSAAAVAAASEVLVTVLPGAREVREALLEQGALAALETGALWLDLSSNDPPAVDALVAAAAERGVDAVGAPMSGGPAEAAAGTLGFFVGGTAAAIDRALPLLAVLGTARHPAAGERPSDAHVVKLLANALWFQQAAAVTEVLLAAQARGLDVRTVRALLADSAAGSVFLDRHAPRLLDGDDMTDFGLQGVIDELDAVVALAREHGTPNRLLTLTADLHHEALSEFGAVDGELLVARLLERRAGRTL